jgi:hypothetical protein
MQNEDREKEGGWCTVAQRTLNTQQKKGKVKK